MIVNPKKTEVVLFNKQSLPSMTIKCLTDQITTQDKMKVLGVIFEKTLNWTPHVETTIKKMNRLTHGLRFLRKRLTEDQFMKATTSQFYGLFYYGSQVWLGHHTPKKLIHQLDRVHYKVLRIVKNDWKRKISRNKLDKIGRAKPSSWADYSTASLVIKVLQTEQPRHLYKSLTKNAFQERRRPGRMKFYDDSNTKVGGNSLRNRLTDLFNRIDFDFYPFINPDRLRINLKRLF